VPPRIVPGRLQQLARHPHHDRAVAPQDRPFPTIPWERYPHHRRHRGVHSVTQDQDFLRLDVAGIEHAGIAFCAKDTRSIGEIIQRLVLIWEIYEPEEMAGRVEYL
jgi:hypothetical protein